jgi:hypothetical protein
MCNFWLSWLWKLNFFFNESFDGFKKTKVWKAEIKWEGYYQSPTHLVFSSLKLKRWSEVGWVGGFRQLLINMVNFLKIKRVKWARLGGLPSITYPHSEKQFKLEGWGEGGRLGLPLFSHTHIMIYFLTWRYEAREEGWVGFCQSPTHIMKFFKVVRVT